MASPTPSRAGLAGSLLGTVAAIAVTVAFLWFGDYVGAAIGALFTLIGAWLVHADMVADTPVDHERHVVRILTGLGGRATEAEFEAALEAATDPFGNYSGEVLEDLREAIERLQAKGRLRIEGDTVVLMPAAND
jgi:hypothetical protein